MKNAELGDGQVNKAKLNESAGVFEVPKPENELEIDKETGKL